MEVLENRKVDSEIFFKNESLCPLWVNADCLNLLLGISPINYHNSSNCRNSNNIREEGYKWIFHNFNGKIRRFYKGHSEVCLVKDHKSIVRSYPDSSVGKESACNMGDPGSIPEVGRSPGEGLGYPLQYSWASLMAQLVMNPPAMQKTWVWSLGWEDHLGKERLPTPVFWPGEFHWLYSPWECKESDTTERLSLSMFIFCSALHLGY